jgi:anti-sigma factor RsiW
VKATDHLTCVELVELVTDYLDASMPPEQRIRFEEHLAYCPGCIYHLGQMRRTIALTGELTEESISEDAERQLLAVFRDWKRSGG